MIINYAMTVLLWLYFWRVPFCSIAEQILQYTKGCPCKTLFLKLAKNNLCWINEKAGLLASDPNLIICRKGMH